MGCTVQCRNTGNVLLQEGHILECSDKHRVDSLLLGTHSEFGGSFASLEAGKPAG